METITIEKNSQERIILKRQEYQGHQLLDVRVWRKSFRTDGIGYFPTTKGVSIPLDLAGQVMAGINLLIG